MNIVSEIISELATTYFDKALADNRECRLLVPAPLFEIAHEVHEVLKAQGKRSFLIVGREETPSEAKGWMQADGLTSERVGSFVAVCSPGVLSHLQDSISGTGGAIRSLAFSDEWPWVDNGPEFFSFRREVLSKICAFITGNREERAFLRKTILELVASSSGTKDRQELLLGQILGRFQPAIFASIPSNIEKFLFHSGLPRSTSYGYGEDYLVVVKGVTGRLSEELRRLDRTSLLSSIDEKFEDISDAERKNIKGALNDFLDGLGGEELLQGLLLLRTGYSKNLRTWTELSLEVLERIFGKATKKGETELHISLSSARSVAVENSIATFKGEEITCEVAYVFPSDAAAREIRLVHGGNVIETVKVLNNRGTVSIPIDTTTAFTSYKRKIVITLQALVDGHPVKEKKGSLHLCGDKRPGFLVVYPQMDVIDSVNKAPEEVEQDDEEKVNVDEPVEVFLLSLESGVLLDEKFEHLDSLEVHDGIIKSTRLLDPCESVSGTITVRGSFGIKCTATVCIEATEVARGEYSLEDEFRTLLAAGSSSVRLKRVFDIFSGNSRERYRNLGNLNDRTNRRTFLSRYFERGEKSHLPVVVNLAEGDAEVAVLSCARVAGNVPQHIALDEEVSKEVMEFVESYSQARQNLFQQVVSSLDIDTDKLDRPIYAESPLVVEKSEEQIRKLLNEYLKSYLCILSFIETKRQSINWGELFLLSYLDCLVDLGPKYGGKYFLLGPWHPLVVAKRFYVQSSILRSSKRYMAGETRPGFNRLATLLQYVTPARWAYVVDTMAKGFKKAYLAALSDPAWILGLNIGDGVLSSNDVKSVLELLSNKLELDSNVLPASSEHLAGSYVKDYLNAYPSRRAIGIRIEESYMQGQVIRSLDDLFVPLKGEDQQVATALSGGIHGYFTSLAQDVDLSTRPESTRLFIYEREDEVYHSRPIDMALLPPIRGISFSTKHDDSEYRLPRGKGDETVFYAPLSRLVSGLEAIPTSQILEVDYHGGDNDSLEGNFLNMIRSLAALAASGTCTNLQANLPDSLKCSWNVLPGMQLDPAIFRFYVRAGARRNEDRALWDYNVDLEGRVNTYYVLSKVPSGIIKSMNKNPVLKHHQGIIKQILTQLGEIGIAVGSEAMKTSSRSLGVVGLVAAIRLFTCGNNDIPAPLRNSDREVGFLLPVDSFKSFLGDLNNESKKRADLLAVQISLPESGTPMRLSACAIECKYSSSVYPESMAKLALEQQALSTIENFKYLVQASKQGGTPEKLALLGLVSFGLRTQAKEGMEWTCTEQEVLQAILANNYDFIDPRCGCVLVSTEVGLPAENAKFSEKYGYWIRLAPGCWPGTGDHENLDYSRRIVGSIFRETYSPEPGKGPETKNDAGHAGQAGIISGTTDETPADVTSDINLPQLEEGVPKSKEGAAQPATVNISDTGEEAATVCPLPEKPPTEGIKFLVGKGIDLTRSEYFFTPSNTDLSHLNIGIVGDLGTGKTQLIQRFIYGMVRSKEGNRGAEPKFLILDYKKDYSDHTKAGKFIEAVGAQIIEPYKIPISLFDVGRNAKPVDKVNKANFFIDVLKKIYGGIGPVQEMRLRQAIKDCYNDASLTSTVPTMKNVYEKYFALVAGAPDSPLSILDNLCSLEVFEDDHSKLVSFSELFDRVTVVDLGYFGSDDQSKNMLVVFFLNIFYDYMIKLQKKPFTGQNPQLRYIDSMLLVDEADNIMKDNFPVLKQLLQQGREFGVGILLASQYLSHFRTSALNYTEPLLTWFIHNVPNISKNELLSIGLTGVTDDTINKIKHLSKHECFYKSLGVLGRFMRGVPFYELYTGND